MPGFNDDEVTRFRISLARISRYVDRQVSGDGMTRTQLSVLGTVARLGPLTAGELADIEGLNPTMLSRILGKLDDAGLLERTATASDRRVVVAEITPAGRSLHDRLRQERAALFSRHLDGIDAHEADLLLSALPALEALAADMLAGGSGAGTSGASNSSVGAGDRVAAR